MSGFYFKNNKLFVEDLPLDHFAREHGTPIYIYSKKVILDRINSLNDVFSDFKTKPLIAYACKANSNIAILKMMSQNNLGADVVSGGELTKACTANIDPSKIVYSGVGKSNEEISQALQTNILQINVESRQELEKIITIAESLGVNARVALRLNPNVDAMTHEKITTGKEENKFGLLSEEVLDLYNQYYNNPHITLSGLSIHIGSQLTSIEPFIQSFKILADFVNTLKADGYDISTLDLGGGLGIPYNNEVVPDLNKYAHAIKNIIAPLCQNIILEPGRFLVGEAGILLTRILYIKDSKKKKYAIIDAGMNDLLRPSLYDAYHEIIAVENNNNVTTTYDIVGPVCETGDTFAYDRSLPILCQDDLLAIMNCGAYGAVMSSNYNTRPYAQEYFVSGKEYISIRKKQTIQDIIESELSEDWDTLT